jgi:hypothetical protein
MLELFHTLGLCGEPHPTLINIIISQPEFLNSINYFKICITKLKSK